MVPNWVIDAMAGDAPKLSAQGFAVLVWCASLPDGSYRSVEAICLKLRLGHRLWLRIAAELRAVGALTGSLVRHPGTGVLHGREVELAWPTAESVAAAGPTLESVARAKAKAETSMRSKAQAEARAQAEGTESALGARSVGEGPIVRGAHYGKCAPRTTESARGAPLNKNKKKSSSLGEVRLGEAVDKSGLRPISELVAEFVGRRGGNA